VSRLPPIRKSPILCYVTDRKQLSASISGQCAVLIEKIVQVAAAGADWIQIREKDLDAAQLTALACQTIAKVSPACRMIINDRLDIACASGAAGVHLGEKSISIADARSFAHTRGISKSFLIGASVHSLQAAQAAEADGADYLIFGPLFATPSKLSFGAPQGLARLEEICRSTAIPVLAIGGITPENAPECYAHGVAGIAGIRIFQEATEPRDLVKRLRNKG
jgi:thiamine-phosphate pyrophosphorylase